ncbi:hypothetical protein HAQ01_05120 [Acidithiobacillus thiooxidans]|uniref:Uncharacterized protein n=1 Tax=Acidithiobacillus sulfurivorans TaxID=1958756 RepID=A0ABS5ZWU9_9PROT|nr:MULTISPECIES: hypothetical protein [Acidithiobacillus]MBU2742905.1 hypothetical protein [Acidithiobacillus albertensis]MBU2759655.1 hypothetical protein [Acidithiobacillus sulfurivorans]MBU2792774.1 hypothetical protein [Acidithiobacillus thiooxidans]
MDDSTEDMPMTPDVMAQQNASPRIMNLQGLPLSPSPWDDASQHAAQDEKAARQHQNKREMLAQRQREEQERSQRQDASDRKYRSYMAALATEERQAQVKGEPMDPDTLVSMLHMGMDAISGGGAGSMISGIVSEDVAKGEDGGQSPEEDASSTRPAPQQPLRD